jgi:DTW domain-containing protein YfiP
MNPRVVLLLHREEAVKASNTGLPAVQGLAHGIVVVTDERPGIPALAPDEVPLILFPEPGALPLSDFVDSDQRIVLIVPDGNWAQARAMRHWLSCIPSVSLPCPHPSPDGFGFKTATAIGKALHMLEGSP